jgi:addiction module HigA family antidote
MARTAIHPGKHLAEQLEELRMSAAELARQIKVPTNRVTQILNGQRAITGDTALRLGHFFGASAEFWLNLQKLYELRIAKRDSGKSVKALPRLTDSRRRAQHARPTMGRVAHRHRSESAPLVGARNCMAVNALGPWLR